MPKISELSEYTSAQNDDVLPIVDTTHTATKKISINSLKTVFKTYFDTLYAIASKGVTNGDSHDHFGGDGAQIDHGGLGGLSDDDHSQYLNTARHDTTTRHTLGTVVPHDDHGSLSGLLDDDHPQYIKHSLATAVSDFLVASGAGTFVKKTLAEVKTLFDWATDIATHAALTTGVHGVGAGTIAKVADITKSQVGLDNVTNDAQLKRAAGDFSTFTEKTAPVDADIALIEDSAASYAKKKLTWSNTKATLKSYFDGLYATLSHTHTNMITGSGTANTIPKFTDVSSIGNSTLTESAVSGHISSTSNPHSTTASQVGLGDVTNDAQLKRAANDFTTFTEKTTPVDADITLIEDSASSYAKKKLTWSNIKATMKSYLDSIYAPISNGVTNGDSHDHNGGDGAQIDHTTLANKGTNTHSQIDTFIASKGAASGLASLNASSLVVQNPANATSTPTASKIPIADASGKLDSWITDASTSAKGKVQLATDGESVASKAVQANDTRLSNARTPTAHASTHEHGGSDEVASATAGANLIPKAGSGGTLDLGWLPSVLTGKDADTLDSQHGNYYLNASNLNTGTLPALRFDDTSHGSRGGGSLHSVATTSSAGFMSSADKAKLDSIGQSGNQNAYSNVTDGTNTASASSETDTFKLRTANNILSIVVTNDDATHGDNALFTVDQTNIDHTQLLNKGTNTHAQIDSHIANTSNPHSTTASQVGLGNVTNDSQLKRASNDFSTFTEKTTPVDADITLIEDSAASYAKKKLSWTNIKATLKTYFDTLYAPTAKGVTNGDSHDHNGGDGAQIDHVNLANKGTNTHAQIDTFIASKGTASGLASLDANSLVVQNPANATATPTASKIPIADASGVLGLGWIPSTLTGKDADTLDSQHGSYYLNASNLGAGTLPSARFDDTSHGSRGGGGLHSVATTSVNGFLSASDKSKLDGIASGAEVDQNAYSYVTDGTNTASAASKTDTFKLRTANSILSIVITNNDATHGDNALFTVNQANIDHTQLLNKGTNTHAQIDSHIASTSNPHSTTADQVGLGNVTNDAQLKRAAGDINTFTDKATPVDADITLIEDSAASYTKKKLTWANIKATLKTYFDSLYSSINHTHAQLHTQGTDTALGTVGTKNPPIDNDKVLYRDSTASDALVTSTWTQIKSFFKTYFDTLYAALTHASRHAVGGSDSVFPADPNADRYLKWNDSSGQLEWAEVSGGGGGGGGTILRFPASCFETRVATGWAEFVQVQGANFDWGELRFDASISEIAISPSFRLTGWGGGGITVRIGFKANATSGDVMWIVSFVGRDTTTPEVWDAAFTDHAFSAVTVPSTAEYLKEAVWTETPSELANNDAVIMKITRDAANAGDTLAVDAKLLYVTFEY
jgi:hypothetical protein